MFKYLVFCCIPDSREDDERVRTEDAISWRAKQNLSLRFPEHLGRLILSSQKLRSMFRESLFYMKHQQMKRVF